MTKIYTKTGDLGETGLWGGARVPKSDPRVHAYGEIDELNSVLGAAIAHLPTDAALLRRTLARVQEELFVVGALLAAPGEQAAKLGAPFDAGLPEDAAGRLEPEIDELTGSLRPMTKFIFPGGSTPGAWLHVARAVCRRAERAVVALEAREPAPRGVLVFLNRLSDYLFTAARWINAELKAPETEWQGLAKKK